MFSIKSKTANFVQSSFGKLQELSVDYDNLSNDMVVETDRQMLVINNGDFQYNIYEGSYLVLLDVSSYQGKKLFFVAPGKKIPGWNPPTVTHSAFFLKKKPLAVDHSYDKDEYISQYIDGKVTNFTASDPIPELQPWTELDEIPNDATMFAMTISATAKQLIDDGEAELKIYAEK